MTDEPVTVASGAGGASPQVPSTSVARRPAGGGPPAPRGRRPGPATPLGPVPQPGVRAFLGVGRLDVILVVALVLVAFLLRAGSPLFPNWLTHPFSGAPVHADGLSFPYNGGLTTTVTIDGPQSLFPASGCKDETPSQIQVSKQETLCGFVFDEVYFPVNAAYDAQQPAHDYFDPEPPLAKLVMAPPIMLFGFGGFANRLSVAIFGSLLCGLVYLIALRLRRDRFFAACAGGFVAIDGLALVEARTGVIDTIAVFFSTLAVYAFLLHWQARTRRQWTATLYLFGACLGLAFGAKLTAIAPLAVAAGFLAVRFVEPLLLRYVPAIRRLAGPGWGEAVMWRDAAGGARAIGHYALAALLVVAFFGASYSRYMTIDHTVPNFAACGPDTGLTADPANPSTVLLHPEVSQAGRSGADASLPQRLLWFAGDAYASAYGHTKASLVYHSKECRDHPYGSRWYTWPVLAHPVLFYSDSSFTAADGSAETGWISNLGNPALWWLAIPALMFCAVTMTRGPTWWRFFVPSLLGVSLAMLILIFHAGEQPPVTTQGSNPTTYLTAPTLGIAFTIAEILVALACIVVVACGVIGRRFVPSFILAGLLVTWLMWMPGNGFRVLFLYHMLNAVPFLAMGLAYALTALRGVSLPTRNSIITLRPLAWAGAAIVVATFVFFYPTWVGLPLPGADHDMRIWFDAWSSGWS